MVHERYRRQTDDRQTTDRRQTDGRTTTYSERELTFTFANKTIDLTCYKGSYKDKVHSATMSLLLID